MAIVVPVDPGSWHSAALTDRGRRRRRNEDAFLSLSSSRIHAVADGMGGHAAGDVAARLAVSELASAFAKPPSSRILAPALARRLIAAFDAANQAILDHAAARSECAGMGTTLTALSPLVAAPQCVISHIGDSRAYRLRAGALTQLTRDHTWVQHQVDAGMLTRGEARSHPLSNVLSRVLGTAAVGPPDTFVVSAEPGDVFLLCSDGLTTMVDDDELQRLLAVAAPVERIAASLVEAANRNGGADNITVIVLTGTPPS